MLVLTVDEAVIAGPLQTELAGVHSELNLDDAAKIVGCWNGLAKARLASSPLGERPMRRAVAFAGNIKASKRVADVFPTVVDAYRDLLAGHDDGANRDLTDRGPPRRRHLQRPGAQPRTRLAQSARPRRPSAGSSPTPAASPKASTSPPSTRCCSCTRGTRMVDVVQSVGRVMRKAEGKDYGYIILPVGVPAGVAPEEALSDNKRYKVVWEVLQALRAHDERFNAMVNRSSSTPATEDRQGQRHDPRRSHRPDHRTIPTDGKPARAEQLAMFALAEWRDAIYARIVEKVGTRTYWEDWAKDVADIADAQITRINASSTAASPKAAAAFDGFLQGLRGNLNDSITRDDAIEHARPAPDHPAGVRRALRGATTSPPTTRSRRSWRRCSTRSTSTGLEAETARLESFYDSVRRRAAEVDHAEGKQKIIAELYEKFFKPASRSRPTRSASSTRRSRSSTSSSAPPTTCCATQFGRGLTDEGVHILDPFTGTGTFIVRLLQSGLIEPDDLARKYANELHANEILLLAYYIAAVNIEATYHALAGEPTTSRSRHRPHRHLPDQRGRRHAGPRRCSRRTTSGSSRS